jgi:hypothetical protein
MKARLAGAYLYNRDVLVMGSILSRCAIVENSVRSVGLRAAPMF